MQRQSSTKPRALFLSPEAPGLGRGGGAMRSQSLLEYMQRSYQVELATFRLREHSHSPAARVLRNASRLLRGVPPLFDRYAGYESQLPVGRFELGVVEHFWCASYAATLRSRCDRLVLDLHNIESQLARTHAEASGGARRWASRRFGQMYLALEREWLPKFDTLLVTSNEDRARLRHPDIRVFPNALPETELPRVPREDCIVFSGNLEYHPNVEAVRWFAQEIWPQVAVALPGVEWRLIGRNPDAVADLAADAKLTGPVADAVVELARGRVCVVPLLSGSGTRFKILEAWAAGQAVVSTTIGAEGLGAHDGEHVLIADSAHAFADAVVRVWRNPELRNKLAAAGRALFAERYTWPAAWKRLDEAGGLR